MLEEIKDQEKLERLLQIYLHDVSLYFPIDFDSEKVMYVYDDITKYFEDNNYKAFYIKYNNNIAGFILLDIVNNVNVIQEMFVLNNYKKQGLGKKAVTEIFDMFKGDWLIKVLPLSKQAEMFWTKVISEYTNNNYEEERIGKYNRLVLTFNNKHLTK